MANHTQTGSIDLTSSYSVHQVAQAGFESAAESYATKTEVTQTADSITQSINSLSSRVDTKADNSTVQTLRSEYNETKTTVSGHETRLSATESVANGVRADFDNLEIGGRNLLRNSDQSLSTVGALGGFSLSETIPSGTTVIVSVQVDFDDIVWADSGNRRLGFEMSQGYDDMTPTTQWVGTWWWATAHTETSYHGRIWNKVTLTRDFVSDVSRYGIYVQGVTGGTYSVSRPKVEIATKPTDWTPAPEDLETEVTSLKSDYANYKQTTTEALSEIGTTYATKTELGTETSNRQTAIQQVNNTIALKADSSDVYTKQQSDGLISTEVANRNAAIEAKASEISLSVSQNYTTKTEFNALDIGVRNLAVRTHAEYPAIHSTDEWSDWITPPTGTNRCYAESYFVYPSEYLEVGDEFIITIDIEWTKFTASGGGLQGAWFQSWANGSWSGFVNPITSQEQVTAAEFLAGDGSKTIVLRGTIRDDTKMYPGNYWKYNFRTDNSDGTGKYRVRHFALRKGNKASSWTPAPEDMASQSDLAEAKAEIKVTTDGITSEVSKKADSATIISTIRQSAESVKIKASQVEIDGTTTFTSGGTLASYVEGKAEDAANAVEIGGRNLVIDSKNFRAGSVQEPLTMSSSIEDGMYKMVISDGNTANWNSNWWPNKDAGWSNVENNLSTGDPFVISFEMRAIGSTVIPNIYIKDSIGYKAMSGTLSESWSTVYYAGTWSDSTYINPHFGWSAVNTASTYYVKSVKVEKGNKPTDWTPAPEDVAANAVNRTQRIYYRSNAAITSWSMPASWVTNDQNTWNNGMSAAGWSTKVTPIASGTGESAAKYLYLYTCEQRQMADGTIYHTPVTLDESTTVIDGGNIITGSITANQVNFADATGNQLKLFDPSSPTNYQAISSTATEFVVGGESRMLISGSGQRIGKEYVQGATDNESHMELDYHSMQMVDKDGNTYFHVSDLRDASGYAELSETFTGDGLSRSYMVFYPARSAETSAVTVDGDPVSFTSTIGATHTSFTLSTAPQSGATVVISYQTNSDRVKAYTLGKRLSGTRLGAYSFCEGEDTTASENCCHAEGYGTTASYGYSHAEGRNSTASGNISHAEGEGAIASGAVSHAEGQVTVASGYASHAQNEGTKAASEAQTAIGKYNVEDSNDTYALIIGNGTAENARSNAFAVKWDGTVETAQDIPWTTLPLSSDWTEYSSARAPKYRRVGALVEIRGAIKPTASTTLNATAVTFANLPQGCRPANMEVSAVCNGSATKMWLLTVDTDGNVGASRMRTTNSTSYQSAGTSEFMIFDVMFFAG